MKPTTAIAPSVLIAAAALFVAPQDERAEPAAQDAMKKGEN